jgi:hypothetical protein
MKSAKPPLQFILVGFESNQHGQAASQEHASSSWPETFHGGFAVFASAAVAAAASKRRRTDKMDERREHMETPP